MRPLTCTLGTCKGVNRGGGAVLPLRRRWAPSCRVGTLMEWSKVLRGEEPSAWLTGCVGYRTWPACNTSSVGVRATRLGLHGKTTPWAAGRGQVGPFSTVFGRMAVSLSDDPSAATEAEPGALTAARSVRPQSVTTARQASPIALLARSPPHRRRDAAFERHVANAGKQHTDVAGEVVEPVVALVPLDNHVGSAEMCGCATDVAPLHRRAFRGRWRASMTH